VNSRNLLVLSLAANLVLGLAVAVLAPQRLAAPQSPAGKPVAVATRPAPPPTRPPAAATAPAQPRPFHWAQIESEDYRQYIANLRALECPERLIRDLIVADLDELYRARRRTVKRERLPPWAGFDRWRAAFMASDRQFHALKEEQRAVTTELLGYPWDREMMETYCREEVAALLLGYLTPEQAMQVIGLPGVYQDYAQRVREPVLGILLPEDRANLEALAVELESRLAALLNPAQLEELMLRLHIVLALFEDSHFEAAEFTGAEVREFARLSRQFTDLIREKLLRVHELKEEERERREFILEAELANALGPEKAADLRRARDERFRDTLAFTRERRLPRQTAVKTYEILSAAEQEASRLRADTQLDPADRQAQLAELQEATAATLTQLLGKAHVQQYLGGDAGKWLNELNPPAADSTEVNP
jgi:hypothetical protein